MIYIKSLKLTNFGRHSSIDESFSGYVVGLTGPNGRGKSTILQALQFALTGMVDTSPAEPMRNFIKQTSGADAPKSAEVEVGFIADGKEGKIVRRVTRTSSSRKLWWDGCKQPITAEKKVSAILEEIMGVDKKAINSTVFIRQGEMDSMFGAETDRRDFYSRLLMLGHLPKISNDVEKHRAHMADTVQDLGAVRDAADAAYEEAKQYFEVAEESLNRCPSQASDLSVARNIVALFEDQSDAEEAVSKASAAVSAVLESDDPEGVEKWFKRQRERLEAATSRRDALNARRSRHFNASKAVSEAEKKVRELEEDAKAFQTIRDLQAELARQDDLGEDPSGRVRGLEETLRQFQRKASLEETLPQRREEAVSLEEKVQSLQRDVDAEEEVYFATKEAFAATRSKRDMRSALLESLRHGHAGSEDCPLCHSQTPPDQERLRQDLEEDDKRLDELEQRGKEKGGLFQNKKRERDEASEKLRAVKSQLEADEKELKTLQVQLALYDAVTVEKDLEEQKELQKAYAAREFEINRLKREIEVASVGTQGRVEPTKAGIDSAKEELSKANEELSKAPWSDEDDEESRQADNEAKSLQAEIDRIQKELAGLESAQKRSQQVSSALQEAIDGVPEGFFSDVLTGDKSSLTTQEAVEKVQILEERQQAHDEARGRKEAANESLKSASRKIDELELRTAEQKHRLKLVDDLERLRDAFKPTGVSLDYINYRFGKIAQMAGDYLAESGADFMVAPSEEVPLCFEFLRTDRENEAWLPQNRLSGGQKVRLAVATLRAIHALVMPSVGLMVLDEPTTHLDEEVKRSMADMLNKIGEEGTLQMVVCDHSPVMVDAFSDAIDIPE